MWFFGAQDCCVFYISCFPESHIFSVLFHNLNFQFSFIMASLLPLFSVKCLLNPSTYLFLCSPNISLMEPPYWLPIPFIISLIAGGGVIVVLKIIWIIQCDYGASQWQIPSANAGDSGSVPGSGRSPEGGNGNPLQYSCLGNPMDIGAWWATGDVVSKSRRGLSTNTHTVEQNLLLNKGRDLNKFLKNEFPKRALEMKFLGVANHDSHNCIRGKSTSDNNKI